MKGAWPASVLGGLLMACGPTPSPVGGSTTPEQGGGRARPASALAGRVGEVLELRVPLAGGGMIELVELRGRPLLLELADSSSPGWDDAQARYRSLIEAHGDALTVVTVRLDPDPADLPAGWNDVPPPFVLGWDPQGAIAARLQLVRLPTVVLLDAQGRIVAVHEGMPPDDAALDHWLGMAAATHA